MRILTKHQAILSDKNAMEKLLIPSLILMENAAISACNIIQNYITKNSKIALFCGTGNNGGDGFAIARHLKTIGAENIDIYIFGDISKMSDETSINYNIIKNLNLNIFEFTKLKDINSSNFNYDCYIEALIGIGSSENLKSETAHILDIINSKNAYKIAVDLPAGLNPDTGKSHPSSFISDLTITMFSPKIGMYLNEGPGLCGKIEIASLGYPEDFNSGYSDIYIHEKSDIRKLLTKRNKNTSKFNYGKVLIIAGSDKYPGAAALTANAAIKSGAGLVYLASTNFHNSIYPEVIQINLSSTQKEYIFDLAKKCDAIAIGPGIGLDNYIMEFIKQLILELNGKKLIIDADGLNIINSEIQLNKNIVLTPHLYEFSRLYGNPINEITGNEFQLANEFSTKNNCILHLKSTPSITSDGMRNVLTVNGNPGMATAGSGDVLTGIIASFMSQGLSAFDATSIAAYIHAIAGDIYVSKYSEETLRASDIIENLGFCFD
jgi:NAD(P)H-hydrate epimerase